MIGISNSQILNLPSTIRSRWHRLLEMSSKEIGYRLFKELYFRLDKWRTDRGSNQVFDEDLVKAFGIEWFDSQSDLSFQNLRRYLQDAVAPRFYFSPSQQTEYARLVEHHFPNWIERAREQARKICLHRFQLLGFDEINLGEQIDWHRDPETGRSWPQKHWSEIDLHSPEAAGDPKLIWELNRHQHLSRLGLAYCYTQDEQYVSEYVKQIEDWIEKNPYQIGINWTSSLEIAFRAINWLWALFFFIKSPRLNNHTVFRITKSIVQHLEAILQNPSIYSSPNTHLIGEAFALYLGGVLLAEHKSAYRWRNFGERFLSAELQRQCFKDGVHKEQSAYYHCYMVEFYLQAAILARRNRQGGIFDEALLERACEFLMHICRPGGELAAFGDEDGGKALMFGATGYRNPADLLAAAAVNYWRGDFKFCAGEYQEATLWLTGRQSLDIFTEIPAEPHQKTGVSFNESGHAAMRADWSATANYLLFHCSAKTHLPGHTHADCLSFEMASGGLDRLIDSGTYKYNSDLAVRNYYRGTSAHNTVRIDRLDQSIAHDEFKWQRQAKARLLAAVFSSVADYVCGEHDGYMTLSNPCMHRRAILFARPDYFIIWDEFAGSGEHYYENFFHCGDASVEPAANGSLCVSYKDGLKLLAAPIADTPIFADVVPVSDNATTGWRSRAYGKKEPCLSLRLHRQASAPAVMLTVLFPYRENPPTIEGCSLNIPNSLCARIRTAEYEDIALFSLTGGEFKQVFGSLNFTGERLFLRTSEASACKSLAINANLIRYNSQSILDTPLTLSQFIWDESNQTVR